MSDDKLGIVPCTVVQLRQGNLERIPFDMFGSFRELLIMKEGGNRRTRGQGLSRNCRREAFVRRWLSVRDE